MTIEVISNFQNRILNLLNNNKDYLLIKGICLSHVQNKRLLPLILFSVTSFENLFSRKNFFMYEAFFRLSIFVTKVSEIDLISIEQKILKILTSKNINEIKDFNHDIQNYYVKNIHFSNSLIEDIPDSLVIKTTLNCSSLISSK